MPSLPSLDHTTPQLWGTQFTQTTVWVPQPPVVSLMALVTTPCSVLQWYLRCSWQFPHPSYTLMCKSCFLLTSLQISFGGEGGTFFVFVSLSHLTQKGLLCEQHPVCWSCCPAPTDKLRYSLGTRTPWLSASLLFKDLKNVVDLEKEMFGSENKKAQDQMCVCTNIKPNILSSSLNVKFSNDCWEITANYKLNNQQPSNFKNKNA